MDPERTLAHALASLVDTYKLPALRELVERGIASAPEGDTFSAKVKDALPPAPNAAG